MADTSTATQAHAPRTYQPRPRCLTARAATAFDGQALAVVNGLPGDGAELLPSEMRALAAALNVIAGDIERQQQPQQVRSYTVAAATAAADAGNLVSELVNSGAVATDDAGLVSSVLRAMESAAEERGADAQGARLAVAADTADALWFTLDEIEAVAGCITLVQEHVAEPVARNGRTDALARAACELLATAKGMQGIIARALQDDRRKH